MTDNDMKKALRRLARNLPRPQTDIPEVGRMVAKGKKRKAKKKSRFDPNRFYRDFIK